MDLKKLSIRTLSASVYGILVIGSIYATSFTHNKAIGDMVFALLMFIFAMIGLYEFYNCLEHKGRRTNYLLGFICSIIVFSTSIIGYREIGLVLSAITILLAQLWRKEENPFSTIALTFLPLVYVITPLSMLYSIHEYDYELVMMIFLLIWTNDTFAYFTGSLIGKHKFWPRHSPGKTWEGCIGGLIFCVILSLTLTPIITTTGLSFTERLILGIIVGVFGTLGDLVESMFKRSCGVKDSGNIMPGHGGILDRVDSLLITTPIIFYIIILLNN